MEIIKSFLESSTIHGLTYISTSRKYVRLFWTLVVLSGFTGAGFMIYQSFQDWNESPVKTTIETRPIKELTYPKVTVCPPKNTFTDLNYDLMMADNMTLNKDSRNEILDYTKHLLFSHYHDSIMKNMSKFQDSKRYYNWYHGYTKIFTQLENAVETCAPNGSFTTRKYGHDFNHQYVDTESKLSFVFIPPHKNTNAILHVHFDIMPMKGLRGGNEELYSLSYNDYHKYTVNAKVNTWDVCHMKNVTCAPAPYIKSDGIKLRYEKNYTQSDNRDVFLFLRDVAAEDVKKQNTMPGFRVDWYYSGLDGKPVAAYAADNVTIAFVRFAKILQNSDASFDKLSEIVTAIKMKHHWIDPYGNIGPPCNRGTYSDEFIDRLVTEVEKMLHIDSFKVRLENLKSVTLSDAGNMFIYLITCPNSEHWKHWFKSWELFYNELFKSSPYEIILTLNRMLKKKNIPDNDVGKTSAKMLFKRISNNLELKYGVFQDLLPGRKSISEINRTISLKEKDYAIINHPVHIITKDDQLSPSAFIPFCEFGGNMTAVGVNYYFPYLIAVPVPVCNSFQAKIINDQICYEIDLNRFSSKENKKIKLQEFNFIMDYNEDRQVTFHKKEEDEEEDLLISLGIESPKIAPDQSQEAYIYLDTIEPTILVGEGEYNIQYLKKIEVTDSYLGLERKTCQTEEPYHNCTTRKYMETIYEECDCLPLNMKLENEVPLCSTFEELDCLQIMDSVDTSNCIERCSGVSGLVVGETKSGKKGEHLEYLMRAYDHYKNITKYPSGHKAFEWKNNLRHVRIYFGAHTYDKITKDRAAKFVDMLSAIGGTMGLLTGFSIISGMEIIYFSMKMVSSVLLKRKPA